MEHETLSLPDWITSLSCPNDFYTDKGELLQGKEYIYFVYINGLIIITTLIIWLIATEFLSTISFLTSDMCFRYLPQQPTIIAKSIQGLLPALVWHIQHPGGVNSTTSEIESILLHNISDLLNGEIDINQREITSCLNSWHFKYRLLECSSSNSSACIGEN